MEATNRSNYAFRFGLRRLATMPTAKSGFNNKRGQSSTTFALTSWLYGTENQNWAGDTRTFSLKNVKTEANNRRTHFGGYYPRICSSHLLRLENHCCNACFTILFLNIIMIMPASQKRSNYAFRCSFLRLVTKPTAKSGLKERNDSQKGGASKWLSFPCLQVHRKGLLYSKRMTCKKGLIFFEQ